MTKKGKLIWKRSLSHIERHWAQEIGKRARKFFDSVYGLPHVDEKSLRKEEKAFWTRYNRLLQAHERAKIDAEPLREAARILQWVLPTPLCLQITDYLQ